MTPAQTAELLPRWRELASSPIITLKHSSRLILGFFRAAWRAIKWSKEIEAGPKPPVDSMTNG